MQCRISLISQASGIIRIYGKRLDLQRQDIPDTWEKLIRVCRKIKNSDSGLSAMTCDEEYVNLLYGYQLARYLGQEKVQQLIRNCTWSQIPQAKEAADDIQRFCFLQDI